jgi:antirestriction protein ArdC
MNVYEIITSRILDSLKSGVVPWRCPWSVETPRNLVSGREYRGVNVLLLQSAAFSSPHWLTFKQAKDVGGSVKRGERGCPVVFWKIYDKADRASADGERDRRFLLRYYTVFNIAQTEGIEAPALRARSAFDPIGACEAIVAGYPDPPTIVHGGGRACYSPALDRVQMPGRESFGAPAEYYSTLFHELTHSTGAASRLERKGVTDPIRFASHDYAFEELVAECGSAFLAAQAGISVATLDNSAAYVASWAKKVKSEPRWIVEAAAQAAKAADWILGRGAQESESAEVEQGVAA